MPFVRFWQLRVGDFRVFYDVDVEQKAVIVRAVRRKGTRTTEEIL
jgi:mRNA-degrading endonuclease RelE of RelBE toxin-antitoxin system